MNINIDECFFEIKWKFESFSSSWCVFSSNNGCPEASQVCLDKNGAENECVQ